MYQLFLKKWNAIRDIRWSTIGRSTQPLALNSRWPLFCNAIYVINYQYPEIFQAALPCWFHGIRYDYFENDIPLKRIKN